MKKTKPAIEETAEKFDQNARIDFNLQFGNMLVAIRMLARNNIRYLLTHLSYTHEFVLSFDQANGLAARAVMPQLFPERKKMKGYYGDSIYFRYVSAEQIEARNAVIQT